MADKGYVVLLLAVVILENTGVHGGISYYSYIVSKVEGLVDKV